MLKRRIQVDGARVLVLGLAFKENCPDLRNTRVVDIVAELQDFGVQVDIHDPWVDADAARHEYGFELAEAPADKHYDGIVLAVAHDQFRTMGIGAIRNFGKTNHVLYDLKNLLSESDSDLRL